LIALAVVHTSQRLAIAIGFRAQQLFIRHKNGGMKFFSRVVFICNCCFIIAVLLRWVENAQKKNGNFNGAISINPLESMLVILGYGAVYINLIFNLFLLALFISKRKPLVARWLLWGNFLFLILQIYYFFFSNF
jgi:hypothetical protein